MRKTITATIGLMLYWPMLRAPYFQNLFFTPSPTGLDGREAYAIANILIVGLAARAAKSQPIPTLCNTISTPKLLASCRIRLRDSSRTPSLLIPAYVDIRPCHAARRNRLICHRLFRNHPRVVFSSSYQPRKLELHCVSLFCRLLCFGKH